MVIGVQVTDVGAKSFIVSWSDPMHMNGRILEYEVHISRTGAGQEKTIVNRTTSKSIKVIGLDTESEYLIQVSFLYFIHNTFHHVYLCGNVMGISCLC